VYTYVKSFPHVAIKRWQQLSNCGQNPSGVQKWLGTNKFMRTKSHTGSKFSEINLMPLCAGATVVVHLYCGFSL